MTNAAKAKGTAYETAVVRVLQELGFPEARRQAQHGAKDVGDIGGVPGFALECKNTARLELASFVDQANAEAANAGTPYGAAIVKRRGKHARQSYVIMDLETFARLALAVNRADDLAAVLDGFDAP